MSSAFRRGAIMLALTGAVALVAAHPVGFGRTYPDHATTGSIDRSAQAGWIQLSDDQRGFIFLGVMNLPDVPEVDLPVPGSAGALPSFVDLQDMPAMVTRKIPLVRDHKFVKLDDRILVVRPSDRVVVAEVPRYRLFP
jgi:hypothetical protein